LPRGAKTNRKNSQQLLTDLPIVYIAFFLETYRKNKRALRTGNAFKKALRVI